MLFQTCVTAHWAAAMAVLATVAALTLLLSAKNTSLIWQKCTHRSYSNTALNVIQLVFYSTEYNFFFFFFSKNDNVAFK